MAITLEEAKTLEEAITLEETSQNRGAADSAVQTAEPEPTHATEKHDAEWYLDQDPTLYPEAIAHILTPRRRTVVTTETFAAIRAACDKP